jgi:hypothetical protein
MTAVAETSSPWSAREPYGNWIGHFDPCAGTSIVHKQNSRGLGKPDFFAPDRGLYNTEILAINDD